MNNEILKIHILMENTVAEKNAHTCKAEWGLSLLIAWKDQRVLLDAGASQLFLDNAQHMGVSLNDITAAALSHHHWDHVDGLADYVPQEGTRLFCHPECLTGMPEKLKKTVSSRFQTVTSTLPLEIGEDIYFLGEIPRKTFFEKGVYKDNPMRDDSALALKTDKGCIVITGCSHSGIVNICIHAEKITGQPLRGVIGGMHLFEKDRENVKHVMAWLKDKNTEFIYPMHCIDFTVKKMITDELPALVRNAGDTITIQ